MTFQYNCNIVINAILDSLDFYDLTPRYSSEEAKLSGRDAIPQQLYIKSNDNKIMRIPRGLVIQCHTLEDICCVNDARDDPIFIDALSSDLQKIFEYAAFFDEAPPPVRISQDYFPVEHYNRRLTSRLLLQLTLDEAERILNIADFLQFDRLVDDLVISVIFRISDHDVDEDFEYVRI